LLERLVYALDRPKSISCAQDPFYWGLRLPIRSPNRGTRLLSSALFPGQSHRVKMKYEPWYVRPCAQALASDQEDMK
jgi:hypothetical protein